MDTKKTKDEIRKVLLGALAIGLLLLVTDIFIVLSPAPDYLAGRRARMETEAAKFDPPGTVRQKPPSRSLPMMWIVGLFAIGTSVAGFYLLSLAGQPDSQKPVVRFVQSTMRSIIGDEVPAHTASTKSEDEIARETERKRLRDELNFRVETEGTKKLYTIEAWQEWRKTERQRILELYTDKSISENEMYVRFGAIDDAYDKGIGKVRDSGIYEEG